MNNKILIIGYGNTLRGDDGIGPIIIERLTHSNMDNRADFIDGGVDGLTLIDHLDIYTHVLIIDAVNMSMEPGTIKLFSQNDVVVNMKEDSLSTHGLGLPAVFEIIKGLGIKRDIMILGIQPETISMGEGFSLKVSEQINNIISVIQNYISENSI